MENFFWNFFKKEPPLVNAGVEGRRRHVQGWKVSRRDEIAAGWESEQYDGFFTNGGVWKKSTKNIGKKILTFKILSGARTEDWKNQICRERQSSARWESGLQTVRERRGVVWPRIPLKGKTMAFFKRREKRLKGERKDVVFKVFLKRNDGSLLEDVEIYRDGTWKALQVPTDDRSLEWFNLIENVRQICLENYKKGGVCIGPRINSFQRTRKTPMRLRRYVPLIHTRSR